MVDRSVRVGGAVGLGWSAIQAIAACTAAFAAPFAGQAASGASKAADLIVRYRAPQNNPHQAMFSARASTSVRPANAEIVNSAEGVVSLRFGSAEEAARARAELEFSGDVVSVSSNLLYSPAVHYSLRELPVAAEPLSLGSSLFSMFFDAGVPAVLPSPVNVVAGADPLVGKDWAMTKIGLPQDLDTSGFKPVIASVIDTGVDYNHPDLSGAMWRDAADPSLVGYDFAHGNALPYDVVHFDLEGCLKDFACRQGIGQGKFLTNPGHGTHCAGHVGAVANNSVGIRGVGAQAAQVMGIKFFYDKDDANAGQGDDAAAIQSIDFAIQKGAKVISASWGGRQSRAEGESSELKQALIRAQKAGLLVVVAAGNDGIDQDTSTTPVYPAAYDLDNLIVVAAVDSDDALADFSSYGARSVHIAAPGVKVFSTTSGGGYDDVVARYTLGGKQNVLNWDGTSMATPIVAGAVSLVWAKHPDEDYKQIRARILGSARKVAGLSGKVATGGVLDVQGALR